MAGIGFTLKKALNEASLSGQWRVYGAAAFVAAGPWMLTLVSLFLILGWGKSTGMSLEDRDLFFATVTYAMIGSNMISTTAQFLLTRYLADALYVQAHERLLSAFTGMFLYTGLAALVLASGLQYLLPLAIPYKIWTVLLTVVLTQMGLLMILLSAARAYRDIAQSFLVGFSMICVAVLGYGVWMRTQGELPDQTTVLALFTIGELITFLWLGRVIIRDFPGDMPTLYQVRPQYRRYPELLWVGLLYALTLWVDNGVRWLSDSQVVIQGSYLLAPAYDLAKFWTFLALIPAFTMFSVHVETSFYKAFRRFYDAIEMGETLASIRVYEEDLRAETKTALLRMAKVQSFVALLAWVLAQQVQATYPDVIDVFQWTIIGSIPHVLWITAFLLLLYFDARKMALRAVLVAVISLMGGVSLAVEFGWSPGSGYLLGSTVMLVITLGMLNRQMEHLLFHAFYDPNQVRKKGAVPAVQSTMHQMRLGYPILNHELVERLEHDQPKWRLGMKLPPRREKHGRQKQGREGE